MILHYKSTWRGSGPNNEVPITRKLPSRGQFKLKFKRQLHFMVIVSCLNNSLFSSSYYVKMSNMCAGLLPSSLWNQPTFSTCRPRQLGTPCACARPWKERGIRRHVHFSALHNEVGGRTVGRSWSFWKKIKINFSSRFFLDHRSLLESRILKSDLLPNWSDSAVPILAKFRESFPSWSYLYRDLRSQF